MSLRRIFTASSIAASLALASALVVASQQPTQKPQQPMTGHDMGAMSAAAPAKPMTTAEKIANAVASAPPSLSAKATIVDWPATEGAKPVVLRPGTNGWTCFPDFPATAGNDPMCVDEPWMTWLDAYTARKNPQVPRVGIGYMMAPGGSEGSNSDPFAMKATTDNHWGHHPPHLMILVPDPKALNGISTDPNNGGPYVMFAGTPYAHVMAPTSAGTMMHK